MGPGERRAAENFPSREGRGHQAVPPQRRPRTTAGRLRRRRTRRPGLAERPLVANPESKTASGGHKRLPRGRLDRGDRTGVASEGGTGAVLSVAETAARQRDSRPGKTRRCRHGSSRFREARRAPRPTGRADRALRELGTGLDRFGSGRPDAPRAEFAVAWEGRAREGGAALAGFTVQPFPVRSRVIYPEP